MSIHPHPTSPLQSGPAFYKYSHDFAQQISQPSLMFRAKLNDGREVMVNDYQEVRVICDVCVCVRVCVCV